MGPIPGQPFLHPDKVPIPNPQNYKEEIAQLRSWLRVMPHYPPLSGNVLNYTSKTRIVQHQSLTVVIFQCWDSAENRIGRFSFFVMHLFNFKNFRNYTLSQNYFYSSILPVSEQARKIGNQYINCYFVNIFVFKDVSWAKILVSFAFVACFCRTINLKFFWPTIAPTSNSLL